MKDVMIDLETMGLSPRGAIVAIGALSFDLTTGKRGSTFYQVVDLASSAVGMEIDPDTVIWWLAQSEAARFELIDGEKSTLFEALDRFKVWFPERARVWGNGATFDVVILRSAFDALAVEVPWHYRAERDVRTLVGLWRDLRGGGEDDPTLRFEDDYGDCTHHALADAERQARYCCQLYQDLRDGPT